MPDAQPQQQARGNSWLSVAIKAALFWLLISYFSPFKTKNADSGTITVEVAPIDAAANGGALTKTVKPYPIYKAGEEFNMKLYLLQEEFTEPSLIWDIDIVFDSYEPNQYQNAALSIPVNEHLLNNGSMSVIAVFSQKHMSNMSWDQIRAKMHQKSPEIFYNQYQLVTYRPENKFVDRQNLITGENEKIAVMNTVLDENTKLIPFWKPNVTISLVSDGRVMLESTHVKDYKQYVQFSPNDPAAYYPVLFFNDFWLLSEQFIAINDTITEVPLNIHYEPLSIQKFMIYKQFEQSMNMYQSLGTTEKDFDDIKLMLLETNPYLLALTVVVTLLHMIFDILAFKNDISYWKNKKTMVGLSVRSIFVRVVSEVIILLYLIDNQTSMLILFSVGIGIVIECWKITKAVNVSIQYKGAIPMLKFEDKQSYSSQTKQYDDQAFKYLGYALFPLVIGYAIYSLYYQSHKSWYSWVIASLTGCVYTFGFIMMTPQLFINYKLKSVAHLPWRTFTYKALNTFIDDLFAFIIRMPTLHRLSCFRDDIIFIIFLVQWYIYPKDKTRTEHGYETSEEETPKDKKDK